jgi:hypothetical protein
MNTQPPQPTPFDTWLTRISAAVVILGSLGGGMWAYSRYVAEDVPALALRPKMQGDLLWHNRSDKECVAEFKIKLENIGKSPIELKEATVSAYPLDIPPLAEKTVAYVDPLQMVEGIAPLDRANILGNYLRMYYPPGVADEVGTMFIVKRDPGKMILFVAEGKYQIEAKQPEGWFWHQWDPVCGPSDTPAQVQGGGADQR